MGNESSSASNSAVSSVDSLFQKAAKSITARPGFRSDKIVVVSSGGEQTFDPENDENLLKLKRIPQFYPFFRSTLNLSNVRDPADLYTKFDTRPVSELSRRLQRHLAVTSEAVSTEQASVAARIREIDYAIATLSHQLTSRRRQYGQFAGELSRAAVELNSQLKKLSDAFQQLAPTASHLNGLLPAADRLPPLDLSPFAAADFVPAERGLQEQRVLDSPGPLNLFPNAVPPARDSISEEKFVASGE